MANKTISYKAILTEIMSNGYYHIKAINNEIQALNEIMKKEGITDPQKASQAQQDQLRALTLTLTLVNDLMHPAHKVSKKLLKKSEGEFINFCINMQKIALTSKLVGECFCSSCKEDKNEAQTREVSQN